MKNEKNRTDNRKIIKFLTVILIGVLLFTVVGCGTEQSTQSTTEKKEETKKTGLMDTIDFKSMVMINYDLDGSLNSAELRKFYRKGVLKEITFVMSDEKVEDLYTKKPVYYFSEPNEQTRISENRTNGIKITYDSNWNEIKFEDGSNLTTNSYDGNGNLIRREKITGVTTTISDYTYDDNNLCTSYTTKRVLNKSENNTGTKESVQKYDIKYEFDSNGYPTRKTTYCDGEEESYDIFTRNEEHQIIQVDSYMMGKLAVTEKYE